MRKNPPYRLDTLDEQLSRLFYRLSLALAVLTAMLGGWYLAVGLIETCAPLSLLLLGLGLALTILRDPPRSIRRIALLCAGIALFIGLLNILNIFSGWNPGFERFMPESLAGVFGAVWPDRMGTPASIGVSLSGATLLLLNRRTSGVGLAQSMGGIVFLIGMIGLTGYLYRVDWFYAVSLKTAVAWPTAFALLLLSLGMIFARPAEGIMKLLSSADTGGRTVRLLLPLSVFLPLVLGYFRVLGEYMGFYDTATGTGLVILLFIIVFSMMTLFIGYGLSRSQAVQYMAQQALRESEHRFRGTFENAAVGIAHVGMDGRWLRVNERLTQITGYSRDELLYGRFQDITYPEDMEHDLRGKEAIRSGKKDRYALEKRYFHKNGHLIWVNVTVTIQREVGSPDYMIAIIQDINDRKRVEEALKRSEESFRNLADAMPQLVWTAEPDGMVDYCNKRCREYEGIEQTESGNYIWETALHPDDMEAATHTYQEAIRTGSRYQFEHRLKMKGRGFRWHLSRGIPIHDEQGNPLKIYGTATDIHEIKKAQEALGRTQYELKTLVENSPDIILRFDRQLRYLFVNSAYEQITGIPRERFIGKTNQELGMEEHSFNKWKKAAENAIIRRRAFDFEFSFPGVFCERSFWGQVIPEFDRGGNIETLMLIARDITERKAAEEHIRYISFHDCVTGLYNRAYFEEEIKRLDAERSLPVSFVIGDVNNLKLVNDAFGHHEGDRLLKTIADILRQCCRNMDIVARWGGDEFALLLPETDEQTAQHICTRIHETAEQTIGPVVTPSIALGTATKYRQDADIYLVLGRAEERMYDNKLTRSGKNHEKVIASLLSRVRDQWPDEDLHLERTRKLAVEFGDLLGLSPSEMRNLNTFILLHDIGKAAVPTELIRKPERLTESEWKTVRRYPEAGFRISKTFAETAEISDDILSMREWWNGTGYPRGLRGEEIPFLSRIVAIVESYELMTRQTPYKEPKTREEAIREIIEKAGKQFDPDLSEKFVAKVA